MDYQSIFVYTILVLLYWWATFLLLEVGRDILKTTQEIRTQLGNLSKLKEQENNEYSKE